ncbi:HDOD domain-containing protein [Thiorhodospira sibirica]|uniref:HDOD domain-containing protein n=1 Tax=Thiorhodospira sibirica TaxID=154347 RepID=UPI00022C11AB|nr:HDOD domain-containing protein [Thiorhodospira sibirica]
MSARIIDELHPIKALSPLKRERLAQEGSILLADPEQEFRSADEAQWFLYLLKGSVTLLEDGEPILINAGTSRALHPLFAEDSREDYLLVLAEKTQILRLDRALYATLKQEDEANAQTENAEQNPQISETDRDIFAGVYQAYLSGKLELPVLPDMAIKIKKMVNDPNIDANKLSRLIQVDMATTAALIRSANSGMYAGLNRINSVRDAIVRLGLETTRNMVFSLAIRHVFKSKSALFKQRLQQLWERSVHISALSYVIARHVQGFDPERAMLAGLLCDIGELPIIGYLEQVKAQPTAEELERIISTLKTDVGEMIVKHWGLDEDIAVVVRESMHWLRETADGVADYCDIVLVARLYYALQIGRAEESPRYNEVPAFARLSLGQPNEALKLDVIEESEEELKAAMDILKGNATMPGQEKGKRQDSATDTHSTPAKKKSAAEAQAAVAEASPESAAAPTPTQRGLVQRVFKELREAQDFRLLLERETGHSYQIKQTANGYIIQRKRQIKEASPVLANSFSVPSPAQRQAMTNGLLFAPSWLAAWPFALSTLTGLGLLIFSLISSHFAHSSALLAIFAPVLGPAFVMMGTALLGFSLIGGLMARYARSYLVSHEGLEVINGLFSYTAHHIPLDKIDAMAVQQSDWERWLGIGNLTFSSLAKNKDLIFSGIAAPFEHLDQISSYINRLGEDEMEALLQAPKDKAEVLTLAPGSTNAAATTPAPEASTGVKSD